MTPQRCGDPAKPRDYRGALRSCFSLASSTVDYPYGNRDDAQLAGLLQIIARRAELTTPPDSVPENQLLRGTGRSDRPVKMGTLEERTDDIRAVMDAVGIERANIFGASEGGSNRNRYVCLRPSSKPISKAADNRGGRNPPVS
jgi:hypothetical protein